MLRNQIAALQKAAFARRYDPDAYHELCKALCDLGRFDYAEDVCRRWLARDPHSAVVRHLMAACLARDVPPRAPDEYLVQEFDGFAPSFDRVLGTLRYRVPECLASSLAEHRGPGGHQLAVLDAGCGTGLCGRVLRPYARRLVGVDLSAGMLEIARGRNLYDTLVQAELTAYLAGVATEFDIIAAGDVFIYFGRLEAVFQAAAVALRPGGCLVFSAERVPEEEPGPPVRLNPTGRYSHAESYLGEALVRSGFIIRSITSHVLRTEYGLPVPGFVAHAEVALTGRAGAPPGACLPLGAR